MTRAAIQIDRKLTSSPLKYRPDERLLCDTRRPARWRLSHAAARAAGAAAAAAVQQSGRLVVRSGPHEQQQMPECTPAPQAQTTVPEGWQHGGWAQPAEAWASRRRHLGDRSLRRWPAATRSLARWGRRRCSGAQQSAAAQGMPLQQHQGGVIFLCDPRTEKECLQRGLFGLPATQTQIVRAIVPEATLLFLFNVRAPSPLRLHAACPIFF